MKQKHIFLLLISIAFHSFVVSGQQVSPTDTVDSREKYGLRLGIDLSKPVRSFLEDDYQGLEIKGDYRLYEDIYLAAELGNEQNTIYEDNLTASAKGSYIKLGANYNVYNNWAGMQNLIFVGIRYGFATFSSELEQYAIYTTDNYFEPDVRFEPREFNNLTAGWAEFQIGIKVEVLNNVYLGTHLQLKRRINETRPNNFDNLYIPGFNRTYDDSTIGVGYGYSISYLLPFYKK
jgi:hypothetical protein